MKLLIAVLFCFSSNAVWADRHDDCRQLDYNIQDYAQMLSEAVKLPTGKYQVRDRITCACDLPGCADCYYDNYTEENMNYLRSRLEGLRSQFAGLCSRN